MEYNRVVGCVDIRINTKRMDDKIKHAQNELDKQVLSEMIPYMPMQQGALRGAAHIVSPGLISVNTPYAHYQYMGELYLTKDGRSWAEYGEKKFPTEKKLVYHTPGTGDRWFDKAKQEHKNEWIDLVRREVGK